MIALSPRTPSGAPRVTPQAGGAVGRVTLAVAVTALAVVVGAPAILGVALIAGSAAAIVDVRTRRLPDSLVVLAGLPGVVEITILAGRGSPAVAAGALVGALGFGGPLLVAHVVTPTAIGFGDVKLAMALGTAIGLVDPRLGVLALCVASGTAAALGVLRREATVPFGPGLVAGAAAALASPWGLGS